MNEAPLISVLLPFYNSERYLDSAIFSILNQTCTVFELILLDDGSSDRSLAIATKIAQLDPRVKVHHHPNMGLCRTLQKGVDLARGKYIARMDADDIAHPERFERQIAYLEQHPNCVVLGTAITVIDPDNDKLHLPSISQDHNAILSELLCWQGARICHPTVMMRTSAVKAVAGYMQEYYHEDIDLFLRLAQCGLLANLPERLLNYRWHLNSVSHTYKQEKIAEIEREISRKYGCEKTQIQQMCSSNQSSYYTPYESYCRWLILARRSGFWRSSLKYLFKVMINQPLAPKSYWILLNVILGEQRASALWNRLLTIKRDRLSSPSPNP